jgi:hypothetical protein
MRSKPEKKPSRKPKRSLVAPSSLTRQTHHFQFAGDNEPSFIPRALAQHRLLRKNCFYTLPEGLLTLVVECTRQERFDGELLDMEWQLSKVVGDHSLNAGIWRNGLIEYQLLEPSQPLVIRYDDVKNLGWGKSEQEIREIERIGNQRLGPLEEARRGYCGWLMTNRTFVEEHDRLIHLHREQVCKHTFPKPILASFGHPLVQSSADEAWVAAFRTFYGRWRLQLLAGPGLPVPLPALLPSFPQMTRNFAAAEGGTTLFLPDILPVSTRGVLPETIENAVHGQQKPEHLAEWLRIVGRQNPAKNVIARYARLFRLQHYWRIVHARHQSAVRRHTARLVSAFAAFFRVSDDSIRKDLTLIARRLGKGWERRPDPLA